MMEYDTGRDIIFMIIFISIFVIHSVSTHQRLDSSSEDIWLFFCKLGSEQHSDQLLITSRYCSL